MLLEIDDWRTIGDLQYRFNKCFPNLNLQFFDAYNARIHDHPLAPNYLLENVRKVHQQGVLNIKSWFTKKEVETQLREQFGLFAKVVPVHEGQKFAQQESSKMTLHELNEKAQLREGRSVPRLEDADEFA